MGGTAKGVKARNTAPPTRRTRYPDEEEPYTDEECELEFVQDIHPIHREARISQALQEAHWAHNASDLRPVNQRRVLCASCNTSCRIIRCTFAVIALASIALASLMLVLGLADEMYKLEVCTNSAEHERTCHYLNVKSNVLNATAYIGEIASEEFVIGMNMSQAFVSQAFDKVSTEVEKIVNG